MATISSPRPSLTLSSRRTSASTDTVVRSEASSRLVGAPPQRRNRAALREFYGIKNDANNEVTNSGDTVSIDDTASDSEFDKQGFDPDDYVRGLLRNEGLEGVLKVEAGLLKDIRGFDGEKKALVYDNYAKLIGATDTIRKMRGNMDPLKPAFTTLTPAISHIASTAEKLSSSERAETSLAREAEQASTQRQAVQYVLDTPARLKQFLADGRTDAAAKDWGKVAAILEKWQSVPGAADVKRECTEIMAEET